MTEKYLVVKHDRSIERHEFHPNQAEQTSLLENVAAVVSVDSIGMNDSIHVAYVDGVITQMAFDSHLGWVS